jgi:hypothetical protein
MMGIVCSPSFSDPPGGCIRVTTFVRSPNLPFVDHAVFLFRPVVWQFRAGPLVRRQLVAILLVFLPSYVPVCRCVIDDTLVRGASQRCERGGAMGEESPGRGYTSYPAS